MLPARFDSLFARLLLSQLLLVVFSVVIFSGFVIVDRNLQQMPQLAEIWAPAIRLAAAQPPSEVATPAFGMPSGIRHHAGAPTWLSINAIGLPGVNVLREVLAQQGVSVDQMRMTFWDGHLSLWLHVPASDGPGAWVSGHSPANLPGWTTRTTVTLGLLLAVVAGMSWSFARRVTRPLDRLRQRMHAHAMTGVGVALPDQDPRHAKASPELIDMDAAYTLLAQRLLRNERERALLLAGVSHDLRSPLARIRLAAEMLPESSENQDGVASIVRNVDHADRLIGSFLEFVQTSATDRPLDEWVDLAQAAQQVVARFERPMFELRVKAPDHLMLGQVSGLLIDRLIVNLVDNALKHGALPVVVEIAAEGGDALLAVLDAGPGLPQAGAAHLLDAFARGDTSRSVPGFGLGLAIAQQIVTRLQGQLSFARDAGGHRVQVRLPFKR